MPKRIYCYFLVTGLLIMIAAKGQDAHFAGVQDMNTWYNPALKTNKAALGRINVRNVKYPNLISYSSKAITFELPLVGRKKTEYDNIPFVNLAAGINTDNSGDGFLNASTAMLSLSYALPLDYDNTYLAIGFQGNYSFNRVGADIAYQFPAQFDKHGALSWALMIDPYASGYNYGYLTAGTGVALFHDGEQKQWYIGGSIRHFNHPYTEWTYSARLPSNKGIQAGYTATLRNLDHLSGYANLTWQAGINEQVIGTRYSRHLSDSTSNALLAGVCYRVGDVLVPDAGIRIGASLLMLYYELTLYQIPLFNYHKKVFEFSYQLTF